jgi:type IV secretory pathway TrbF-like protein
MDTTELTTAPTNGAVRPADLAYKEMLAYEARNSEKARERGMALCVVTPLMLLFLLLFLGQYFQGPRIEPLVQVAQVSAEGKIELHGPPQKLLAWQPEESQINDMLADWVRHFYSRSTDPDTQKVNQHWVDRHTCGPAVPHLRVQRQESKTMAQYKKVQVGVKKIEKTPAPKQYHVIWQEIETYAHNEATKPLYSSVMTVGRVKPTDKVWYAWNKSGLCVDTFSPKKEL